MTNNTFNNTRVFDDRTTRLKPEITAFLDKGAASLQAGEDVEETIALGVDGLQKMRCALPTRLWKEFATIECRKVTTILRTSQRFSSLSIYTLLPSREHVIGK